MKTPKPTPGDWKFKCWCFFFLEETLRHPFGLMGQNWKNMMFRWGWVKAPLLPYLRGIFHIHSLIFYWLSRENLDRKPLIFPMFPIFRWGFPVNIVPTPSEWSDFPRRGGEWERCRRGHSQRRGLGRSSCPASNVDETRLGIFQRLKRKLNL